MSGRDVHLRQCRLPLLSVSVVVLLSEHEFTPVVVPMVPLFIHARWHVERGFTLIVFSEVLLVVEKRFKILVLQLLIVWPLAHC